MGKHDKKKRHRHSSSSNSDSHAGGASSSDGSESSGERHHRKRHKEKKPKHKKHKKSDSKEKRKLKEAKKFLKAHLNEQSGGGTKEKVVKMVPVAVDFPVKPISSEDYFVKNHEFSKWLKEQKGLTFNGGGEIVHFVHYPPKCYVSLICEPPPSVLSVAEWCWPGVVLVCARWGSRHV